MPAAADDALLDEDGPLPADFGCPRCGGSLAFSGDHDALACDACGHAEAPEPPARERAEALTRDALARGASGWGAERIASRCDGCGAGVSLEAGALADRCPFCASPQVRPDTPDQALRPSRLAPFTVSAEEARKAARAWLGTGWMHPGDLAGASVKALTGVYLPFWRFGARARGAWQADVRHRRGKRVHWRRRRSSLDRTWDALLVPGTSRVTPRLLLGTTAPAEALAYDARQLAGWQAQSFDLGLGEALEMARARMHQECEAAARSEMAGSPVRRFRMRLRYEEESWELLMLPLWIGAYRHGGRTWQLLVDGRTGRVTGTRPVAWGRVWAVLLACAIPGLVALLIPPVGLFLWALGAVVGMKIWRAARAAEHG